MMARTAARFKQDDVKRVLRVARDLGMGARVDLVHGTIDILPKPIEMPEGQAAKPVPFSGDFSL